MNTSPTSDNYSSLVSQVMEIDDITWGDPKKDFVVRFRGKLIQDIETVRILLTQELRPQKISPIIRTDDSHHTILLISDPLTSQVARVFDIEETNWAEPNQNFIVCYRGRLLRDSMEAYDFLAETLRARETTPLFRVEDDRQVILLVEGVNRPRKSNLWVNLVMFILTLLSVFFVGVFQPYDGPAGVGLLEIIQNSSGRAAGFTASLLAILLAHEFGHYIAGRIHKTAVTLPYFLPLPFLSPFGTLGAFIQLKEAPKNKRVLHDIGIAGPLAGFVVAVPVVLLGLSLSNIEPIDPIIPAGSSFVLEGNSVLYLLAKFAVFGEWLPSPASYGNLSPINYWIRYFFTGLPFPLGGRDVLIHPVAFAGWGGLLVTAFNLIPAGQLDGGHLIYVLLGKRARRLLPFVLAALIGLGFVWQGWWLWVILIFFVGRAYAEPLDQITALDPQRRTIAILGLIIFFLVFTPIPLRGLAG